MLRIVGPIAANQSCISRRICRLWRFSAKLHLLMAPRGFCLWTQVSVAELLCEGLAVSAAAEVELEPLGEDLEALQHFDLDMVQQSASTANPLSTCLTSLSMTIERPQSTGQQCQGCFCGSNNGALAHTVFCWGVVNVSIDLVAFPCFSMIPCWFQRESSGCNFTWALDLGWLHI